MVSPTEGIPTFDLSTILTSTDPTARRAKAIEFAELIHTHGACGIIGHGISLSRLRSAFAWSEKFFNLPTEIKNKAPHPKGMVPHRGYSGFNTEKCLIYTEEELEAMSGELSKQSTKALDFKEHYDIGSEQEKVHYNLWIPEEDLPGFRAAMIDFFWEFESLSKLVLDAMLEGLQIDEKATEYYRSIHTGHQNGIRPIHYPPINEALIDRDSLTWCPTHTDFTSFTLLAQDLASGLQIEDRKNPGNFFSATTEIEDRLYLTIGDHMEIWTNGYFPSSRHRVVIPSPADGSKVTPKRFSMPYFVTARHDGVLEPQTTGKAAEMPQGKFKKMTVAEHIEFRMKYQYTDVDGEKEKSS